MDLNDLVLVSLVHAYFTAVATTVQPGFLKYPKKQFINANLSTAGSGFLINASPAQDPVLRIPAERNFNNATY